MEKCTKVCPDPQCSAVWHNCNIKQTRCKNCNGRIMRINYNTYIKKFYNVFFQYDYETEEYLRPEILYNYKQYSTPLIGIFNIDTNVYGDTGWIYKHQQHLIIGETDDCYIHTLKYSEISFWEDDKRWTEKSILPLGIHKTKFVKWISQQLDLFYN